jgi:hypothetical protein
MYRMKNVEYLGMDNSETRNAETQRSNWRGVLVMRECNYKNIY